MLASELAYHVAKMPWTMKGAQAFQSDCDVSMAYADAFSASLDTVNERFIQPMAMELVTNRPCAPELWPFGPWQGEINFPSICVLWRFGYESLTDLYTFYTRLIYTPTVPDRSILTYFWIGELAEAA
jgi:hypothetical protein